MVQEKTKNKRPTGKEKKEGETEREMGNESQRERVRERRREGGRQEKRVGVGSKLKPKLSGPCFPFPPGILWLVKNVLYI